MIENASQLPTALRRKKKPNLVSMIPKSTWPLQTFLASFCFHPPTPAICHLSLLPPRISPKRPLQGRVFPSLALAWLVPVGCHAQHANSGRRPSTVARLSHPCGWITLSRVITAPYVSPGHSISHARGNWTATHFSSHPTLNLPRVEPRGFVFTSQTHSTALAHQGQYLE